jgi:hypothetical protein
MYVTTYNHAQGYQGSLANYQGYRFTREELQFGVRGVSAWRQQSVDGYVKFRIPVRDLKPGRATPYFYPMAMAGGNYPNISESEHQAYMAIRKSFLFFVLPTPGGGRSPGSIDISKYVIEHGSTIFR